jgi:hypothetical protein
MRANRSSLAAIAAALVVVLASASAARAAGAPFRPGDVLVGLANDHRIIHLHADGTRAFRPDGSVQILDTGLGPAGLQGGCFDGARRFYVTTRAPTAIVQFDSDGTLLDAAWGGVSGAELGDCFVDRNGNFYVTQSGDLLKFTPNGTPKATIDLPGGGRYADLSPDGCTLYYGDGSRIRRFDVCTGQPLADYANLGPDWSDCEQIEVRADGEALARCFRFAPTVVRIGPAGVVQTYALANGRLLELDPDGQTFWSNDTASSHDEWGYPTRFDIATGAVRKRLFFQPEILAVVPGTPPTTEGPRPAVTCRDGVDNDGDGSVDTADSACAPPLCDGRPATLYPGAPVYGADEYTPDGPTFLAGTPGDDVIVGGSNADTIFGSGGDDLICALGGDDDVRGADGDDRVFAGDGADTVRLLAGDDFVNGGGGADVLRAAGGNDEVRGADGDDRLEGAGGDDQLTGGPGDDVLAASDGFDRCQGGPGYDRASWCEEAFEIELLLP